MKQRDLEKSIHTKLEGQMGYSEYLRIEELTALQQPRSTHHDEMLFIIQHQTSESMKLVIHELGPVYNIFAMMSFVLHSKSLHV